MPNVNAYAESTRNQPQMTPDSYNEMDALVFSDLSYVKFDDVSDSRILACATPEGMTLGEFANVMLQSGVVTDTEQIALLENVRDSGRYSNLRIANCAATEQSEGVQWAGITIKMEDDSSVVAFRGTDGTTEGWAEDLELGYSEATGAQQKSAEYLKNCEADSIYMTGHSKGGNDAISAYLLSDSDCRGRVERIDNFDGPGVNDQFMKDHQAAYDELGDVLHSYFPKDSIIGRLLRNHPGQTHYVNSEPINRANGKESIFHEHDSFNWQFKTDDAGNMVFDETEQSYLSKFIDKMLDETLASVSPEVREQVLRTLIEMDVPGMIAGNAEDRSIFDWVRILADLDLESKEALIEILGALIVAGVKTGYEDVINMDPDELLNNALAWLEQKAQELSTTVKELPQKFAEIIGQIGEKISDIVDKLCDFLSDQWQKLKSRFDGTYHDTFMEIKTAGLIEASESLYTVMDDLADYREELRQIQNRMSLFMSANIASLILQGSYICSMENKCKRTIGALNEIAQLYDRTEKEISHL